MRLGPDQCARDFFAVTRYHGDVIRNKRRQKTPLTYNGANGKNATPPARFTQPWQNRHQNVRLGRGDLSITFLAVTRYHGDVNRNKLRNRVPH